MFNITTTLHSICITKKFPFPYNLQLKFVELRSSFSHHLNRVHTRKCLLLQLCELNSGVTRLVHTRSCLQLFKFLVYNQQQHWEELEHNASWPNTSNSVHFSFPRFPLLHKYGTRWSKKSCLIWTQWVRPKEELGEFSCEWVSIEDCGFPWEPVAYSWKDLTHVNLANTVLVRKRAKSLDPSSSRIS